MKIFEYAIPILIIAFFIIGIPLGYKLVLGGPEKEKGNGIITRLQTTDGVTTEKLDGKKIKIFTNYVVIESSDTGRIYLPSSSIKVLEYSTAN